ncbi:unnamed protein product [Rotaria sp. Silwood2]|nr:unnamed protein product [Rotaria sp. Silwood2]
MNSNKYYTCACCAGRVTASSRRPLIGKCIRLFVATRLFPTSLSTDGYICTKCRIMYNKWMALPEFCNILRTIDNNHETEGIVIDKTSDEDGETKMCMDVEINSDDSMDDASVEIDSTDGGSDAVNKEDSSSSDDDSFDDSADNGLQAEDEEVTAVEANEVMDTTSSGGNLNRRGVGILIEVAISSRSQCCVCKEQMMPPTVTIREEDRNELFIRRHIEIPSGSRCCKKHTVDKRLLPEAFLSLVPHKVEYRLFSPQRLINVLQTYRSRLNYKKHLDFDECMSLTDADYVKLTGFSRAQHTQILSHIPSGAMKNSTTN